jgi:hypothetical protein
MYRQPSSSRTGSALLCRASSHKRYNSDFHFMTKKAKFRKIRFKPFGKDGNYNPWFDTVQSRSGTIFTQCIQQFSSSETSRPIQNAYSQLSMSSTSTKNRTLLSILFLKLSEQKSTTSSCLVVSEAAILLLSPFWRDELRCRSLCSRIPLPLCSINIWVH